MNGNVETTGGLGSAPRRIPWRLRLAIGQRPTKGVQLSVTTPLPQSQNGLPGIGQPQKTEYRNCQNLA